VNLSCETEDDLPLRSFGVKDSPFSAFPALPAFSAISALSAFSALFSV